MPTNQDILNNVNDVLDGLGVIGKAEGGSLNLGDVNFGTLIPFPEVMTMIDLARDQSQWLKAINVMTKSRATGKVPIYDLNGYVLEYVGEQDPTTVTTRPATTNVPYRTRKHKADIVLSFEELREARALGLGNFERTVVQSFTTQLGNNVADIVINGDRTRLATTRENRAMRGVDGVAIKTATANVVTAAGKAFDKTVFPAMRDRIPAKFRNDPSLRWWYNPRVKNAWQNKLTAVTTALGDKALTSSDILPPLGISPVIVPHIHDDQGPAAIAPTSASDETTYIQFILTTLVTAGDPVSAAAGVDRRFKVTCKATGVSEICTGILDTTLRINTVGLLGQTTVSVTNTDYEVRPADETDIYLGNPKGVMLIWCLEWRATREYNKNLDQYEVTIYLEFDVLVPVPEAIVKYTYVAVPPITW